MWPTKPGDTSPEIYKRYRELNDAYTKISDRMKINGDGELMSAEDTQEIEKLVEQLTSVYCDWIGYNTKMIGDQKNPPWVK
jgi:2-oxoglutarate dehydrogenase complex dehydrogenase (E1) component-like enzyme